MIPQEAQDAIGVLSGSRWRLLAYGTDEELLVQVNPDRPLTEDAAVELVAWTMWGGFKDSFNAGQSPMFLMQKIMGRLSELAAAEGAAEETGGTDAEDQTLA